MKRVVITGCASRGDGDDPYLTRYVLAETRWGRLCLHWFHRSDHEGALHDHPWLYVSLLLWHGYVEVTPAGRSRKWPGMVLFRPATHIHRVELVGGKPALTLVWTGRKVRSWGFWVGEVWEHWRSYFERLGC